MTSSPPASADFVSPDLPAAVARVARSVVAVAGSRRSVGSGTVWRDGAIVAAAHRVWRAERVRVLLPDGESAGASVKGLDPATDLALLALDDGAAAPTAVEPSEASDHPAGSFVFAVARDGSGLVNASFGHVGASAGAWRTWRGGRVDRLIRLDGGLYPGYSGAPVADASGRTIGIATSALSRVHGIVLPASTVDRVLAQLAQHGRIVRGFLGIATQAVRLAESQVAALGLAPGGALLVTGVADDGPAAKAGLLVGDLIAAIGDARVESIDDLRDALGGETVGRELPLKVARGGDAKTLGVTVGERPRGRCG